MRPRDERGPMGKCDPGTKRPVGTCEAGMRGPGCDCDPWARGAMGEVTRGPA